MPFAPVEPDDDRNLVHSPPHRRKQDMLCTGSELPRRGLEHPTFTIGGQRYSQHDVTQITMLA